MNELRRCFTSVFSDAWADRLNVIPNNTESVALGAITVGSSLLFPFDSFDEHLP